MIFPFSGQLVLLNLFSKFYEEIIKDQHVLSIENYFRPMISTYRKNCSTEHVIIRLVQEWREHLDENFVVGTVLTGLTKAFDCLAYEFFIAKLAVYGFSIVYSYLSNRKQCVRINNMYSNYQKIILGVPQGSILRPTLFNLLISDLFFFVSDVSLRNFVDGNALSAFAETILELIDILQLGPEKVIYWFNKMIANPDKFQAISLNKRKIQHTNQRISVDNQNIKVNLICRVTRKSD